MPSDDTEVLHWSHHLKLWLTDRGRSQRSVEEALGWGVGYLSQLLRPGSPDLKVKHLLAILKELRVSPREFFAGLYAGDEELEDVETMSREEIRELVSQSLREELSKLRQVQAEEARSEIKPDRREAG